MKNFKLYIAVFAGLVLASCSDYLDREPFQSLDADEVFQELQDYEYAMNGAYAVARSGYLAGYHIIVPEVMTDNLILCSEGRGTYSKTHAWEYTSASEFGILWSSPYSVIRCVNEVIENLQDTTWWLADADSIAFAQVYGEALALRAMAHFDMVRYFGKSYTQATSADLGVPYIQAVSNEDAARNTVQDNYTNILDDLHTAERWMTFVTEQTSSFDRKDNIYLTLPAVQGLLARVYLTMEDWQQVYDYTTLAINNAKTILYKSVADSTTFMDVWTDASEAGVIFKIKFTTNDATMGTLFSQTSLEGTRSEFVSSYDLDGLFAANDRRHAVYIEPGNFNGKNFNHVIKYQQREGENKSELVDYKALRVEEMVLTRAEAAMNLGDEVAALEDLNTIRRNRYESFSEDTVAITGAELDYKIKLERRLEFAFEGLRWFDLKRWNAGVEREDYGDQSNGEGVHYINLELPADNFRWELPIPTDEITANDLINSSDQNPGY